MQIYFTVFTLGYTIPVIVYRTTNTNNAIFEQPHLTISGFRGLSTFCMILDLR